MNRSLEKYIREGGELMSLANREEKRPAQDAFPCKPGEVFSKQVSALARRLTRIGVKDVVIGISGGLDSTLCLLVACETFNVCHLPLSGIHCITMPGFGTTTRTKGNADALCEGLGVTLETIDIKRTCRAHLRDIGHSRRRHDAAYENAQARMRTMILMDKANMLNAIVLGTGDLSEIALGWCTYNGDHMSMFGVNSGVPKTVVKRVCGWWTERPSSPKVAADAVLDIIATPVSPELVKNQKTEDTIGPYELHDFFIWNFIMNNLDREELLQAAIERFKGCYRLNVIKKTLAIFLRRLVTQAFKRNCAPDGIRVFPFDFSPYSWHIPSDMPADALM